MLGTGCCKVAGGEGGKHRHGQLKHLAWSHSSAPHLLSETSTGSFSPSNLFLSPLHMWCALAAQSAVVHVLCSTRGINMLHMRRRSQWQELAPPLCSLSYQHGFPHPQYPPYFSKSSLDYSSSLQYVLEGTVVNVEGISFALEAVATAAKDHQQGGQNAS